MHTCLAIIYIKIVLNFEPIYFKIYADELLCTFYFDIASWSQERIFIQPLDPSVSSLIIKLISWFLL